MADIVISSGVVSSGIVVGEDTQLIVKAGGTVSAAFVSSFECGPIVVESGGLAVSTVIEDGAVLRIHGTANNTTATNIGSATLYDGGVASNTTVDDCSTLEISGGAAVSTTVENCGEVYISGGIASNTIVNYGYLTVYEEGFADTAIIGSSGMIDVYGSAANVTLNNGGELFIDDGGVVNGLTASGENSIYVDSGGKLTGRITLDSSPVTLTADAVLDFDISAQAPGSAALLNDYSLVAAESGSVFTITVDANQAEGTYSLAGGVTMFGGSLTVGTTDTEYGSVDLDDPLVYGDYTYTLTLTEGALDLTIAAGGGMILIDSTYYVEPGSTVQNTQVSSGGSLNVLNGGVADNTTVYSSGTMKVYSGGLANSNVLNSSGTLIVSSGGLADSTTVNLNGKLTVYPGGTATTIVENGGWADIVEGGSATFVPNTISGITFEYAPATVHSGTTAVDITLDEWGTMQVFDGGVVDSVTVNPYGGLNLFSGGTATNIIENGGGVQLTMIEPGDSATMTFLPNTFSGAVAENGRIITAHSGTTAIDVTAFSYGSMEVYSGGVLRGLTLGSAGNAVIQPGGKLTGSVTLDSNLDRLVLTTNAILDFDISSLAPGADALLNDYSLITLWGVGTPTYTVTVDAAQAEGTYALAGGADGFAGTFTLGTTDTAYGTVTVNGDALVYGDYSYTLTLSGEGALDLTVAGGEPPTPVPISLDPFGAGNFKGDNSSLHDVIGVNPANGVTSILVNNGNDSFSPYELGAATEDWKTMGVGDFNADGVTDVLWRNMDSGLVGSWLVDNSNYSVTWKDMAGAGIGEWEIVGTGDFNGDGTSDVLWYNTVYGTMLDWKVQDGGYAGEAPIAGADPAEWSFSGVGDFNGDGTDDILWQNNNTGACGYWQVNDGGYAGWHDLAGVTPGEWTLLGVGDFDGNGYDDVLWLNNDTNMVGCWAVSSTGVEWNTIIGAADLDGWRFVSTGDFNSDGRSDVLWAHDDGTIGAWITDDQRIAVGSWMPIA